MDKKQKQQSRKRRGGGLFDLFSSKTNADALKKKITKLETDLASAKNELAALPAPETAPAPVAETAPAPAPAQEPEKTSFFGGKTKKRRNNKPCRGTLYKVGGKYYCVGEKISKKVNGKTVTTYPHK